MHKHQLKQFAYKSVHAQFNSTVYMKEIQTCNDDIFDELSCCQDWL